MKFCTKPIGLKSNQLQIHVEFYTCYKNAHAFEHHMIKECVMLLCDAAKAVIRKNAGGQLHGSQMTH